MTDAHRGMNILEAEFTARVEDLVKSLDKFTVPAREKNELLSALGGMKGQIVGKSSPSHRPVADDRRRPRVIA